MKVAAKLAKFKIAWGILLGLALYLIVTGIITTPPVNKTEGSLINIETVHGWPMPSTIYHQWGGDSCSTTSGCPPAWSIEPVGLIADLIFWVAVGEGFIFLLSIRKRRWP